MRGLMLKPEMTAVRSAWMNWSASQSFSEGEELLNCAVLRHVTVAMEALPTEAAPTVNATVFIAEAAIAIVFKKAAEDGFLARFCGEEAVAFEKENVSKLPFWRMCRDLKRELRTVHSNCSPRSRLSSTAHPWRNPLRTYPREPAREGLAPCFQGLVCEFVTFCRGLGATLFELRLIYDSLRLLNEAAPRRCVRFPEISASILG